MKMSDIGQGLERTWDTLAEGWHNLIGRTSQALTLFHPANKGEDGSGSKQAAGRPRWSLLNADLYDEDGKLVVKLEAPGLEADDLDISIVDNVLMLQGEKRFEREENRGEYRLMERAYGRFSRSIPLGYEVDADTAKASYKRGILTVELNKKPDQHRRRIKVKA